MTVYRSRDWVLFTVCSCVLYLAGVFSPALSAPAALLASFPAAFLSFEYGALFALSSVVLSAAVAGGVLSGAFGLLCFLSFGAPGVAIGVLLKSNSDGGGIVVMAATMEFFGKLAGVLAFFLLYGINILTPDAADIKKSIAAYGLSGLSADAADAVIDRVILLIPYAVILFSAIEALACLMLLSRAHKKRTGEAVYSPPPFSSWAFPRSIIFSFAVGVICSAVSSAGGKDIYLLKYMGANLTELSKTIFSLQGMSCVYFFMMKRSGVPRPFRIMTIVLMPMIYILGIIFAIVGIADMSFNFRKQSRTKGDLR